MRKMSQSTLLIMKVNLTCVKNYFLREAWHQKSSLTSIRIQNKLSFRINAGTDALDGYMDLAKKKISGIFVFRATCTEVLARLIEV